MKSNEEYLDELLKSMKDDPEEASMLTQLQGDGMDDSMYDDMELEEEGDLVSELLQLEEGSAKKPDAMSLVEDRALEPLEEESVSLMETQWEEIAEEQTEVLQQNEFIEEGNDASQPTLEQLMAEMHQDTEDVEEELFLDEDSIDALLSAAKASTSSEMEGNEEETLEFDLESAEGLAEIEELLNKSDKNEIVDEESISVGSPKEFVMDSFEEDEEQELSIDELDALLEKIPEEKKEKKKWGIKMKKSTEQADTGEGEVKGEKTSIKDIFRKIFSMLMEEIPESEEPAEAKKVNISDENMDILNQLDQEEANKGKGKKAKKEKKEKKPKKEKPAKEKKPKKEKPPKEKKPKKEKPVEPPEKKLPKKKVRLVWLFAFSVLAAVLLLEFLIPPMLTLNRAREAFDKGEYKEAYQEYYGQKLSEEDEQRFQAVTVIMRMQTNLDGYNNYLQMGDELKAVHSLIEGVHVKEDVFAQAEQYGAVNQVEAVYQEIISILNSKYQLSEEDAYALIQEKSDVTYTKKIQALIDGNGYVEEETNAVSQDDLLPEEEALFQGTGE